MRLIEAIVFYGFVAVVIGSLIYLHFAGPVNEEPNDDPDYWDGEEWQPQFDTWAEHYGER